MAPSRAQRLQREMTQKLTRQSFSPFGARQIYAIGILFLLALFMMFFFRGQVPAAVDKVFASQAANGAIPGEQAPGAGTAGGPSPTPQSPTGEPPKVDLAERRRIVAQKLAGSWHDVPDGSNFAETPGYRKLLSTLIDHLRPGDRVDNPPLFDREVAMRTPELMRSETFRVRGFVTGHWAEKLDQPLFEMEDVWRVFLTDGDGDLGIVIDVAEQPPALDERRDMVEMHAQFYRVVRYPNHQGVARDVPYLIARNLRVVPEARRSLFDFTDPTNLVMVVALGAMVIWGTLRVISSTSRKAPRVQWRAPRPI
jgi:hypothetical protein